MDSIPDPLNNYYENLGRRLTEAARAFRSIGNTELEESDDLGLRDFIQSNFPTLVQYTERWNYPGLNNPAGFLEAHSELVNPRRSNFSEYDTDEEQSEYKDTRDPMYYVDPYTERLLEQLDTLVSPPIPSYGTREYKYIIESSSLIGLILALYTDVYKSSNTSSQDIKKFVLSIQSTVNQFFENTINVLDRSPADTVEEKVERNTKINLYNEFSTNINRMFRLSMQYLGQ